MQHLKSTSDSHKILAFDQVYKLIKFEGATRKEGFSKYRVKISWQTPLSKGTSLTKSTLGGASKSKSKRVFVHPLGLEGKNLER